jgi:hypothetical protein
MELAQCISRFLCTPIPKLNPLPCFLSTNLPNQSKTAPTMKPSSLIVNARQGGGAGAEAKTTTSVAVKDKPKLGSFHVSRGYLTPFGATIRPSWPRSASTATFGLIPGLYGLTTTPTVSFNLMNSARLKDYLVTLRSIIGGSLILPHCKANPVSTSFKIFR